MADWVEENPKTDGSVYNIYSDGLKVYTTIDSKMQDYAEQAVDIHMAHIQKEFSKQNEKNKTAPFRDITEDEINLIMDRAIKTAIVGDR